MFDLLAAAGAGAAAAPPAWTNLIWIFGMIAIFWFLIIRPQMKRQKEQRQMMDALAKGDEVVIGGGIAGRISAIGEVYLSVELADGVVVKVEKSSINKVLPKGTLKSL